MGWMAKVLIVDQAEIFLKLERSFLLRAGCHLYAAAGPQEILRKARRIHPDLVILLSRGRGGPGGIDCARGLKEDPATSAIPLILIRPSGGPDQDASLPCDRILDDPVGRDVLLEAVSSLVKIPRRDRPRVRASLSVILRTGATSLRSRTKDVSARGLFVLTSRPLETGLPVRVEFNLTPGNSRRTVAARGTVVRSVTDDPSSYLVPGNAVRLQEFDETGVTALEDFIRPLEAAL
jgi:CheY-like chemotaxis protein